MPQLLALAKYPNIAVKVTGGPQYVTDPYPFKSLQPRYKAIYDAFGPERMFWGTDITRMPCTWRECVTAFAEHQPWLSERDKSLIRGKARAEWVGGNRWGARARAPAAKPWATTPAVRAARRAWQWGAPATRLARHTRSGRVQPSLGAQR